ncbi:MAG: HYR domain-containing protein [Thaumarchaeota archaeon]|nr:HYR domain-containing protein [Nitrososphaerota archaeon]
MRNVFFVPIMAAVFILGVLSNNAYASPSVNFDQTTAYPGTLITATGSGFSSSDTSISISIGQKTILGIGSIPLTMPSACQVSEGNFVCTFLAPEGVPDTDQSSNVEIHVTGSSGDNADVSFVVKDGVGVYPNQGPPGTLVTVYGKGFLIYDTLSTIKFNGAAYGCGVAFGVGCKTDTNPSGMGCLLWNQGFLNYWAPCQFIIPQESDGTYSISAQGFFGPDIPDGPEQTTTFQVTSYAAKATISPAGTAVNKPITVTGSGFPPGDTADVLFNGVDTFTTDGKSGCPVSSSGSVTCSVIVPEFFPSGTKVTPGPYTITVEGFPSGITTAPTSFWVAGPYPLSLTPSQAVPGSSVTVTGNALESVDTSVVITFNGQTVTPPSGCPVSAGSFTCSIIVPSPLMPGPYTIKATGNNAQDSDLATFFAQAGLSLTPLSGPPGSSVSIIGSGFSSSDASVALAFNGQTTTPPSCAVSAGSFTCSITVPSLAENAYNITATGNNANDVFTTHFEISGGVRVIPPIGEVGSSVTVAGNISPSDTSVALSLGSNGLIINQLTNCPVSSGGVFSCSITIPHVSEGTYAILATGNNAGDQFSVPLVITPSISLSPSSISPSLFPPGSSISVTGSSFSISDTSVALTFNGKTTTPPSCPVSAGSFTCSVAVPTPLFAGTYTVNATGNNVGDHTSAILVETPAITVNPTTAKIQTPVTVTGTGFSQSDFSASAKLTGNDVHLQSFGDSFGCNAFQGSFTCLFLVPYTMSPGTYTLDVTGQTGDKVSTKFSIIGMSLNPVFGLKGSTVNVIGGGFSSSDTSVILAFNKTDVTPQSGCPVSSGNFVCAFTVPNISGGGYNVTATGNSGDSFIAPFSLLDMELSKSSGPVGSLVNINGSGFEPASQVSVLFNGASIGQSCSTHFVLHDGSLVPGSGSFPFCQLFIPLGGPDSVFTISDELGDRVSEPFQITNVNNFDSQLATFSGGSASTSSTITGISMAITGSNATDGTPVHIETASITGPYFGFPLLGQGTSYYSVGFQENTFQGNVIPRAGTARTCITTQSSVNGLTMQYGFIDISAATSSWSTASNISTNGNTICGNIPLDSSGVFFTSFGEEIAVGPADTTPPVITVPTDVIQEATGPQTMVTLGIATANDVVDGSVTVTNNATTSYPVGITKIQYTATDLAGNTATAYQTVTITDTTPPTLTLPTQVTAQATGPSGATVTYTTSATDLVDGSVTPVCTPPSGNTFAFGTTQVTCTATDAHNNQATGTFDVLVQNSVPPTLSISSPANNAIVNTATVPVSGTASDIVSVSKISWKVDTGAVSTISGITPGSNVNWSFTTNTLSLGTHTIQVNATDSAGLVTISTVTVTYAAPTGSIPPPSGSGQITFNSNAGGFTSLSSISQSNLPTPPPPGHYPLGFFSWSITGFAPATSVTVTVTSPTTLHHQSHYFKLIGGTWVSIPVTVHGNTMTFTISDNGPFDGNPTAGIISDPATVADPTNGRVTGGGNIGKGTNFGFDVQSDVDKTNSIRGNLEYQDKYVKLNLHSNDISFLSVDSTTSQATIVGITDYDRHDKHGIHGINYTFLVTISDPDKTGQHDTFSITVTDSTGKVVYQNTGTVKGHIEIHKFADHDDKSDSGHQHGNNSNNDNRNKSH